MTKDELNEVLEKEFYTVKEVADMISVTPATIRRYVRNGKMRAFYQGMGSRMKIPAEDVYDFLIKGFTNQKEG